MSQDQSIAVLGAGTMGAGIAQVAALAGLRAVICDLEEGMLERGLERIQQSLDKGVARGKTSAEDAAAARERVTATTDRASALADIDIVVEAVPEKMELKKSIFAAIDQEAPKAWLLATNTSSLSVTEIAGSTKKPERVLGLHFFNPPPIMKLVEVIRAARTAPDVLARTEDLVRALGKTPVTVLDAPGFATSRLGLVIGLEAMRMVEQGVADAAAIDTAMELGYRYPMGPLKTGDYVGLDIRLHIAEHLFEEIGEAFRPPMILRRMVRAGFLGRKSGAGFYRWSDKGECLGINEEL